MRARTRLPALLLMMTATAAAQALIEGKIVRIAEDTHAVVVNVGSRHGLKPGDTLNVFTGDVILTRLILEHIEEEWASGRLDDPTKISVVKAEQVVSTASRPQGGLVAPLPATPATPPDAPADDRLRQLNDLKFRYEELIDKYNRLIEENKALQRQVEFSKLQEESEKVKQLQTERDRLVASLKELRDHFNLLFNQNNTMRAEKNRLAEELEAARRAAKRVPEAAPAPSDEVAALQARVASLQADLDRTRAGAPPPPTEGAAAAPPANADLADARDRIARLEKELADARSAAPVAAAAPAGPSDEGARLKELNTQLQKQTEEMQKQVVDMARELRALKAQVREAGAGSGPPPAPRHAIRGKVVAVSASRNMVILNAGVQDGVEPGFLFTVLRGDQFISRVKVENVDRDWCSAQILGDYSKEPIQVNDSSVCGPAPDVPATAPAADPTKPAGKADATSAPASPAASADLPALAAGTGARPPDKTAKETPEGAPAASSASSRPSADSATPDSAQGTVVGTTGNQGQIVLSLGSLQGVQKGQRYQVFRKGTYVAHLDVIATDLDYSIGRVTRVANGESIQVGDTLLKEPDAELTGKIVDTAKGIILSLGVKQGAAEGQIYRVIRGEQTITRLEITKASEQWSEARILGGKALDQPVAGDKIVLERVAPPGK